MSATDELRRMLDERGAEWWEEDGHTLWYGESIHHAASAFSSFLFGENERVHLNAMVTPEQAIEATLGRGTCHAIPHDNLNESEGMGDAWETCSECGALLAVITDNQPTPNFCPNCGAKVVE